MKLMAFVLGAAVLVSWGAVAGAAPLNGYYESELSGAVLDGVWSESYVTGSPGAIGNTIHAASLDGQPLAYQWELSGPAIAAAPVLLLDTVDGAGNGLKIWYTTYSGGTLSLKNTGPWWNAGDPGTDYLVNVTSYSHNTQCTYENGVVREVSTTVEMSGVFAAYPAFSVNFIVAQALQAGQGPVLPAGYPAYIPANPQSGGWGVAQKIRMEIVPEPATLALLACGLGLLRMRRRK